MTARVSQAVIDRAAAAIANARGGRRGVPEISNVLDLLPPKLLAEVREDAEAVFAAVPAFVVVKTEKGEREVTAELAGLMLEALEDGLSTLIAVGAHNAANGQPWATCPPVARSLYTLRNTIAKVEGRPLVTEPLA